MRRLRVKNRKTSGHWGPRVDALIRACGWSQKHLPRQFGCSAQAVRRVRYGGRPKVEFLLRLRVLESLYAPELEALAQGLIATRGRTRYQWVDFRRGVASRPPDLQDLGCTPSFIAPSKVPQTVPPSRTPLSRL